MNNGVGNRVCVSQIFTTLSHRCISILVTQAGFCRDPEPFSQDPKA